MDDSRVIKVDIRQDDIEHTLPLGEFTARLVAEMRDIPFRSRLFSTRGVVDQDQLDREISGAVARVIQRIRDER